MTGKAAIDTPVLEVRDCSKSYPGVQALSGVSLAVGAGEVRGLVGQNGAGKSTLIKVVAGAVSPDRGQVFLNGAHLPGTIPTHRDAGIAVIYQDPGVIPALTACENVFLGDLPAKRGVIDSDAMRSEFGALCAELGVSIDPYASASSLSLGDRQLVEVMRAMRSASAVLVLDEPTSALPEKERSRLFEVITRIKAAGVAIVFISHDLDEVLQICDTVTVLRDGQHVQTAEAGSLDRDDLVTSMVGHAVARISRSGASRGAVELRVESVTSRLGLDDVSFEVHAGEILGLAGLLGSGRSEILRALAGADRVQSGEMTVAGRDVSWPKSVRDAKRLGIHMVSEDRRTLGLVGGESTTMNVALGSFDSRRAFSAISVNGERRRQRTVLDQVKYPVGRESHPVRNLSGGNQQKVLLARLLALAPRVVLLDEPTAGIDVEASAQILRLIQAMAQDGAAVVVVMSDLQELLSVTDRVQVVRRGALVKELQSADATEAEILHLAFAQPSEGQA